MEKQWKSGHNVNNRPTETTYFALMLFTKHRIRISYFIYLFILRPLAVALTEHTHTLSLSLFQCYCLLTFVPNSNIGTAFGSNSRWMRAQKYVIFEVNLSLSNYRTATCVRSYTWTLQQPVYDFEHWNDSEWRRLCYKLILHHIYTRCGCLWSVIYKCNEFHKWPPHGWRVIETLAWLAVLMFIIELSVINSGSSLFAAKMRRTLILLFVLAALCTAFAVSFYFFWQF